MAADREEKWKKYFSSGPVDTKIKAKAGEQVPVYDSKGKSIDVLEEGHDIHVPKTKEYNARYQIIYKKSGKEKTGFVNQSYVAKPIAKKGATESLGVRAETLTQFGASKTIKFAGNNVKVKYFKSHKELGSSLLKGLKANKKVSEGIYEVFEKYIEDGAYTEIEWTSEVAPNEINELGKYVGEIIIGLLALSNKTSSFSTKFYTGKPIGFAVPDDPSFTGVDSFLEMSDGEIVPISSKYGVGAKASLFANLLPKAMKHQEKLPKSVLKSLCESAQNARITADTLEGKRGSKEVLYTHGVNKVLKLKITNPYAVFNDIKTKKKLKGLSPDSNKVISAIQSYPGVDKRIIEKLPFSVTAFFSREIADNLNNDKESVKAMLEILAGKNFWQANLDINNWKNGRISYKLVNSGKSSITVIGSKAAMDDIEAKQGMINYELKLP
jgi:hypothetical protein